MFTKQEREGLDLAASLFVAYFGSNQQSELWYRVFKVREKQNPEKKSQIIYANVFKLFRKAL